MHVLYLVSLLQSMVGLHFILTIIAAVSIVAVSSRPDNLQHHGGAGGVEMSAEENE